MACHYDNIFFAHRFPRFAQRELFGVLCPPLAMFTTLGGKPCRLDTSNTPIGGQGD
jgi:hypothetical protein